MACPEPELIHAYVDGELDAASALRVEGHLATCDDCRRLRAELEAFRSAFRTRAPDYRPTPEQRAVMVSRFWQAADPARPAQRPTRALRPYWVGALGGALLTALVAVGIALTRPDARSDALVGDLVGAHVRSILSERLIDVASSDRHTVKPWFALHADVSPPVVDLAAEGYPLVGGRVDYVDGRRAAVSVYRRGAHLINVFAWPDSGAHLPRGLSTRSGYNVLCWQREAIDFCAASDAAGEELSGLTRLLASPTTGGARE